MLDNQPSNTIIIFDPYSTNGFFLAQKLRSKGYSIILYSDSTRHNHSINFSSYESHGEFMVCDLLKSCNNNFVVSDYFVKSEYLIVMNSKYDVKWIFDTDYDFENEIKYAQVKEYLIHYAQRNHIKIKEHEIWHASPEILNQIINTTIAFLHNHSLRRLYLNTLDFEFFLMENSTYLALLESSINQQCESNLLNEIEPNRISLREVLRLLFEELGAEIEFCGKGENERGVIVDYDESILRETIFNSSKIRLGNTIIKIDGSSYDRNSIIPIPKLTNRYATDYSDSIILVVKRLIKSLIAN